MHHFDDKIIMASYKLQGDPSLILNAIYSKKVLSKNKNLFHILSNNRSILGCWLELSSTLTDTYSNKIYFMRPFYYNMREHFSEDCINLFDDFWREFENSLKPKDNYYIIHAPATSLNMLNEINSSNLDYNFCGGTICYHVHKKYGMNLLEYDGEISIRVLDQFDRTIYKTDLLDIAFDSFDDYFSQYHISPLTRTRAPLIYKEWIRSNLNDENMLIVCAFHKKQLIGFSTIGQVGNVYEVVLSAVKRDFRSKGVYRDIMRYTIETCLKKDTQIIISTQIDNYIVQRVWVDLGFKPYYTFYNFHVGAFKL